MRTLAPPPDLPGAGFAAGPCLFKDTMQLAAFTDNSFILGHSAMLVNEGLPLYLVSKLEQKYDLDNARVGILGMAFKGGSDDIRIDNPTADLVRDFKAGDDTPLIRVTTNDPDPSYLRIVALSRFTNRRHSAWPAAG